MRRVSGKISLATRRIWGDPEDEDELSAITSLGLRSNGSDFSKSIEEGGHSESSYNDGILPASDSRVSTDCISFSDVKVRSKIISSGQALEKDGELPIDSKKSKSSLDEKHSLLSTDSDTPDKILYDPLIKATQSEQTDRDFKKNGDSSFHDSISSSVACPPLSYHDAIGKDFAPYNGTNLTMDHIEAPQDLHKSMNISHECSKMNIEDQRISEVMTKTENRFFASENSNTQENVTSTDGPYFGEHINNLVVENAVEDSSIIPMEIESKDLKLRNSDPLINEVKLQLNYDANELDNDNIPEIVPSKLNKLESCDEKISNNFDNEISQLSALLEIENQLICKSNSESHFQLCSKEINDGNDTLHVVEPIIFNENYIKQDNMSSSVTDLSDSLAVENKQDIDEAPDKKNSTNLDLSDEIICLNQPLPFRSHLEPKNDARDSVSSDENKSSRCTEITEYTSEEFANPIESESIPNVAKDESDENNQVSLNIHESQMRSEIDGISNEEVDEGYTLITTYKNSYKKSRVSDTKFEDNHGFSRKSSNEYSDCTNILLTNVQDSKENDNILNLSDGDGRYYSFQSSGLNLPDIVNQHTARVDSIEYKDKSPEYDHKIDEIHRQDFEDTENLLEVNYTSKGEMCLNNDFHISNSAEVSKSSLLDANNYNISVKNLNLDTEKYEVDLKDSDEAENGAGIECKNKNNEKIEEIIERIEDMFADNSEHTTMDITSNYTVDTTADEIENRIENRTEEILDRIEDIITDIIEDTNAEITTDITTDMITDMMTDITTKNTVRTTADKIEDRIEEKNEEILDRIEDIITDKTEDINEETITETTTNITVDQIADTTTDMITDTSEHKTTDTTTKNTLKTTTDKIEDRIEEKTEDILDKIEAIIVSKTQDINADTIADHNLDTTASRIEEYIEDRISEKTEPKSLEIINRIEDRTEVDAKDIVENLANEKVTTQGSNQAGDDIEANFSISEASKSENIRDKNDYNIKEVHEDIKTHRTNLIESNDLKIESVVPIDQKTGNDNKKLPLENAELSETETTKATRNRKTWLRYVKSFEKRHEEGDSSSIKLSSGRESSGQSERVDRGETIAFTPKIPESPMKKKYAPSHSDSITPDKRRRSFRKKIKEKISDTLHKLKD